MRDLENRMVIGDYYDESRGGFGAGSVDDDEPFQFKYHVPKHVFKGKEVNLLEKYENKHGE